MLLPGARKANQLILTVGRMESEAAEQRTARSLTTLQGPSTVGPIRLEAGFQAATMAIREDSRSRRRRALGAAEAELVVAIRNACGGVWPRIGRVPAGACGCLQVLAGAVPRDDGELLFEGCAAGVRDDKKSALGTEFVNLPGLELADIAHSPCNVP